MLIFILLTTFSVLGTESYLKANAANRMAHRETQSRQAVYAAEGGIEWAKAKLLVDPVWRGGSIPVAGNQVQVTVSSSGGGYWVTSLARTGLAQREIKVYLNHSSGKWSESHYQELHR